MKYTDLNVKEFVKQLYNYFVDNGDFRMTDNSNPNDWFDYSNSEKFELSAFKEDDEFLFFDIPYWAMVDSNEGNYGERDIREWSLEIYPSDKLLSEEDFKKAEKWLEDNHQSIEDEMKRYSLFVELY